MSFFQALRACAASLCIAAALAVGFAAPAPAVEALIGVDSIEFKWPKASGDPPYYAVWITRLGTAFKPYQLVETNRVRIDVKAGERVAIYVHGARPHPDGGWELGPASEISPTVYILGTPSFRDAEDGHWIAHCSSCRKAVQRDLADPLVASSQFAPLAGWTLATRTELADGSRWLVWQSPERDRLLLSSFDDPTAPPIGPMSTPPEAFEDVLDIDGDGGDEFLFVAASQGNQLDRYALGAGNTLAWSGSSPGMVGGELGPIADYTGDGRDDLLWIHRERDLVAVWSFGDFHPEQQKWIFRDSFLLDVSPARGYQVAAAADYDGNGEIDLLWRGDAEGDLWLNYRVDGAVDQIVRVPGLPGDDRLEVVGSPEVDAVPGAELALRDLDSGRLWILYPAIESYPAREAVIDAGAGYETVYVGP